MSEAESDSLASQVISVCRQHHLRLVTAESCTGGMLAAALTDMAGASDVLERGFVTYSNEAKSELLGVPASLIATDGAVSEAVARAMASGALAASPADLVLAITGLAGPGGSAAKPEGRVHFALAARDNTVPDHHEVRDFSALGRRQVRQRSVAFALTMILAAIASMVEGGNLR